MKSPNQAIEDYCGQCQKDCDASCPLSKGRPSRSIVEHCHDCQARQGITTHGCQAWSCPLHPYSERKSLDRVMRELRQ